MVAMTLVERPLRRVSSMRGAISDLQVHLDVKNSVNLSAILRQDSKFEKLERLSVPGAVASPAVGLNRNESPDVGGVDAGASGMGVQRRLHSSDQAVRRSRVLATCCISGLVFILLLLQIATGGFGVLINPLKVQTLGQMKSVVSDMQINALREDSLTDSGVLGEYWKALPTPLKQIANNEVSRSRVPSRPGNGHSVHQLSYHSQSVAQSSQTGQELTQYQASDSGPPIPVLDEQVRSDRKQLKSWLTQPVDLASEERSDSAFLASDVVKRVDNGGISSGETAGVDHHSNWGDLYPWAKPLSSGKLKQCVKPADRYQRATDATNGYILMFANGGLNQMRTGICDMVAVARVLNATLVIPELDHTSYWADPSDFGKVFDVEHFITSLQDDVKVVVALPPHLQNRTVFELAPRSWSETSYYEEEILPLLKEHHVIRFVLTDSRLANNRINRDIQRLRCRANYRALTFHPAIRDLANKIITRLNSQGPFIALHLRYEKDMLAFSGCTFGLSRRESLELKGIRYNVTRWKEKEIDPVQRRAEGSCPLTPREIGLMLKAMGYPETTVIYVAAGQIYGGEQRMKSFTSFFPNVVTKETLASPEELSPFKDYQNRMAALDYMVAVASDVFVPTYDGNMARAVQGHRRFLGHKRTLMPDRVELVKLFDSYISGHLDWITLKKHVQRTHRSRQGSHHERKPLSPSRVKQEENFYANPTECLCRAPSPAMHRKLRQR